LRYVVTEFLSGIGYATCSPSTAASSKEQAAMLGLEVASALAYVHARGFVHGAVRPKDPL
jgi:serine/threonine protein kinase